ncbi:MAG TPA: hypothetical protein VGM64_04520 [Lacunisphaera sp.]|jgi:hypothetical protein
MTSPFPPYLAEANPLAGLTRCIRQICLLREQGGIAEAQQIEQNEFANTLRDLRLAHGPEILPESELRTMFAAEQKRVADAVVLSELLIPQLVKSFGNSAAPIAQLSRPAAAVAASQRDSSVPIPKAAAAAGVSPMIADLLDAMLASERGGRRPASSSASS